LIAIKGGAIQTSDAPGRAGHPLPDAHNTPTRMVNRLEIWWAGVVWLDGVDGECCQPGLVTRWWWLMA